MGERSSATYERETTILRDRESILERQVLKNKIKCKIYYSNKMNDITTCVTGMQSLSLFTVDMNIFKLAKVNSSDIKKQFHISKHVFPMFPDRALCSLLLISSTMLPSRAGCRTGWAAGWPEPTSCTAAPAGNTSRSWPTRGSTPTETTERYTVRWKNLNDWWQCGIITKPIIKGSCNHCTVSMWEDVNN